MAENLNADSIGGSFTGEDISETVENPREKVTTVALPRDEREGSATRLEEAPEFSIGNLPSEAAAVNYVPPAVQTASESRLPPPGGVTQSVVSALVEIAKFARRRPGVSLAAAAGAGFLAGIGLRRI